MLRSQSLHGIDSSIARIYRAAGFSVGAEIERCAHDGALAYRVEDRLQQRALRPQRQCGERKLVAPLQSELGQIAAQRLKDAWRENHPRLSVSGDDAPEESIEAGVSTSIGNRVLHETTKIVSE